MENAGKLSNSAWWNTHISENNTKWIAENVEGVDRCVKEMLLLLEQDGSIENINLNQPGLIAYVKEISNRHHLLTDLFSKLTEELRTCIKSASGMQNYLTPDKKLGMNNDHSQVVSSNISLSSAGGVSDGSFVADSGSSFSSDSDSEYSSPNERLSSVSGQMLKHKTVNMDTKPIAMGALTDPELEYDMVKVGESEECETLLRRISEYEEELKVSNEKLMLAEEKIAKLKSELQNKEAIMIEMGSVESQLASAENQIRLHEEQIDMENKKSLLLQTEIVELEGKLESEKRQVSKLQESVNKYTAELSVRDLEIQKLNGELQDASGSFALEKWHLESCITKLTERVTFHVAKNEELQMEFESLANELTECESAKVEIERKQESLEIKWRNDFELLKLELCKKNEHVDTLNNNLDDLKQNYDMRMAEKDDVNAKLQTLSAEVISHDHQLQFLEKTLQELLSENKQLKAGSEISNKEKVELKFRIEDLEEELGRQRILVSERDEEKREAIRQLCFSLDHYRSAYEEIRSTCVFRKPAHSYGVTDMILAS